MPVWNFVRPQRLPRLGHADAPHARHGGGARGTPGRGHDGHAGQSRAAARGRPARPPRASAPGPPIWSIAVTADAAGGRRQRRAAAEAALPTGAVGPPAARPAPRTLAGAAAQRCPTPRWRSSRCPGRTRAPKRGRPFAAGLARDALQRQRAASRPRSSSSAWRSSAGRFVMGPDCGTAILRRRAAGLRQRGARAGASASWPPPAPGCRR